MRDGDLEGSLIEVIGDSGGKDLLQDAGEFALDSVLNDGVVKDIPVVGTVAKLYGTAVALQGYAFARKLRKFLLELSAISPDERSAFASHIQKDQKLKEQTADVLITFLAKMDDTEKAPMLARAFAGYIQEEYDLPTFRRLATAIDRCLVVDLPRLEKMTSPVMLDGYIGDMLASAGLASIVAVPAIRGDMLTQNTYQISHLGELFLQVVIKGKSLFDE